MPKIKIEINGYAQAKALLDELPIHMQKKVLLRALRRSAAPMQRSAKSHVPVRGGDLRDSIKIVRFKDKGAPKSEVSVAIKPVFSYTRKKGKVNAYYGRFIHEGTKDPRQSRKKGRVLVFKNDSGKLIFAKSTKGIKANPFLEKAYSGAVSQSESIFEKELVSALEKFINKNFKKIIS